MNKKTADKDVQGSHESALIGSDASTLAQELLESYLDDSPNGDLTEGLTALIKKTTNDKRNIEELTKAVEDTRFSRQQFSLLFEKAPIGFVILNPELRILEANTIARGLINLSPKNVKNQYSNPLIISHIVKGVASFIDWIHTDSADSIHIEFHDANKKGQVKVWQASYTIALQKYYIISIIPIAQEYALNKSLQLFKMVFDFSPQAIVIADINNKIIEVNPSFTKITGYEFDDVMGKDFRILSCGDKASDYFESIYLDLKDEGYWKGVAYNKNKKGGMYPSEIQLVAAYDDETSSCVTHYVGMFDDISERVEKEEALKVLSEVDSLTGIYNRQGFNQQLEFVFTEFQREGNSFSILFFDLDKFKYVNDHFGHDYGDQLLKILAMRLKHNLKKGDIIARLGGDEFVVILPNLSAPAFLEIIANKLIKILSEPYQLFDVEHSTTASIGIASYPNDAIDKETLLKAADSAMYQAKSIGRGCFQFFNESLLKEYSAHQKAREEINFGIIKNQFQLHFQAQHDMATGDLVGFEALARWYYSDEEIRMPVDFLPIIENEQEMIKLGRQLINQAFVTVNTWSRIGFRWPVSINLSVIQLKKSETYELIERLCETYPRAAGLIQIEITEVTVFENDPLIEENLNRFKRLGLDLILDDFGTGYSSIYSLKKFPFDCIKIDKSFIDDISNEAGNKLVILNGIISLIQELGIDFICEGVETQQQVDYLVAKGCRVAQGYFYNKPMSKIEIHRYVEAFI